MSDLPIDPPIASPPLGGGYDHSRDLAVPAVALAIGAHPDDIEFGAGGTLAKWAAEGCVVHHLVCTDGSKGTWDPAQDRDDLIELRQHEQRAAAAALGATGEVVFLGYTDGELDSTLAERERVAREIRRLRPDVVAGHDPWKRYRLHPDHRHAGYLAVEGIVAARDPLFFPHQDLEPHRPDALLLWEADQADHVEDITATMETKLEALRAHTSQMRSTMGVDLDDPSAQERWNVFGDRVRAQGADWGQITGCRYGEGFKLIEAL